jgi:hypothetical protein
MIILKYFQLFLQPGPDVAQLTECERVKDCFDHMEHKEKYFY